MTEVGVDLKDLRASNGLRELSGSDRTLRDIACRKLGRLLASIELVLQCDLHSVSCESDAPDSAKLGADTCDPGNKEVGVRQVEERRVDEGGDR